LEGELDADASNERANNLTWRIASLTPDRSAGTSLKPP
jgi:hypothetical protein